MLSKKYQLDASDMAKPMVRVRGLHLQEANLTVNGEAISGGMFDLVATSLLTAQTFIENNQTPKFYFPSVSTLWKLAGGINYLIK